MTTSSKPAPWLLLTCILAGVGVGLLSPAGSEAPAEGGPANTLEPSASTEATPTGTAPTGPASPREKPRAPRPPESGPLATTLVLGLSAQEDLAGVLPTSVGITLVVTGTAGASRLLAWSPGQAEPRVLEPALRGGRPRLRDGKLYYLLPERPDVIRARALEGGDPVDHRTGVPGLARLHFVYPDGDTLLVDGRLPARAEDPARPLFLRLSRGLLAPLALPPDCVEPRPLGVRRRGEVVTACGDGPGGALVRSNPHAPLPATSAIAGALGPVRAAAPRPRSRRLVEDAYLWPLVHARPGQEDAEVVNLTPRPVGLPAPGWQWPPLWTPGDDTVLASWPENAGSESEEPGRRVLGLFSRHTATPARSYPARPPERPPLRWASAQLALWTEGPRLVAHDLARGERRAQLPRGELRLVGEVLEGERVPTWRGSGPSELVWLSFEGPQAVLEPTGRTLPAPPDMVFLGGSQHGWYLWSRGDAGAGELRHLAP